MIILIGTVCCGASAGAQTPAPAAANPISQSIKNSWNNAKLNLRESAEQMPEEKYGFKPVDTVKSFGAILAHVAGASYDYCSGAKGEAVPFDEDHFEQTAKTKAEILKAVNDAIAYCDPVYAALTDQSLAAMISRPGGTRQFSRASQVVGNIAHTNEHYGNLVTYFRLNGMVPPSTARASR
ncbi:MAG TPA: DinB family protein [Vicinamibacterales bacterium]|jgi:uncharacterized damage-inducible protein DinB